MQAQRPAQNNIEKPKSRNPTGNGSSNLQSGSNNTSNSNYDKKASRWDGRAKDHNGGSSKSNGERRAGGGAQTNGGETRGRRLNNNDQSAESDTDQDYYVGQKDKSHKSTSKRNKVEVEIEFEENEDIYEYGQKRKGRPHVMGEKHRQEPKNQDTSEVEDHSEDYKQRSGRGKKNLEGNYVSSNNDAELNGQNRRRKEVERSRDSENNTEEESADLTGAELEINA